MRQTLHLIRGLPGSGKSYTARKLKDFIHLESDMFRTVNGEYVYDPCKNQDAHKWCEYTARYHLNQGENVVVSNVFYKLKQIEPYITMAEEYKVRFLLLEIPGTRGSIHNVPESEMERLKLMWQEMPMSWRLIDN